jgi:uncharacterized protein (DUF433 family)
MGRVLLGCHNLTVASHRQTGARLTCIASVNRRSQPDPSIEGHPGRVSGAQVFRSSRLPVSALFENLEGGASPAQFVERFDGVTTEQVREVLNFVKREPTVAPN